MVRKPAVHWPKFPMSIYNRTGSRRLHIQKKGGIGGEQKNSELNFSLLPYKVWKTVSLTELSYATRTISKLCCSNYAEMSGSCNKDLAVFLKCIKNKYNKKLLIVCLLQRVFTESKRRAAALRIYLKTKKLF